VADTEETAVLFRRSRKGNFVTAVFPCIPADDSGDLMSCFAHVGQHGAAGHAWFYSMRPAKPAEYAELKRELESEPYGYRLKVFARIQPWMHEARRKAAKG
jgi:hypothetical protein